MRAFRRYPRLWFGGLATASASVAAPCLAEQRQNRVLADHHRVCLTSWSVFAPRPQPGLDRTSKSVQGNLEALLSFLKSNGYEGLEISTADLRVAGYFPQHVSDSEIATAVRAATTKIGVKVVGTLLHVLDGQPLEACPPAVYTGLTYTAPDFWDRLDKVLQQEKALGSEYISFQLFLPEDHMAAGGSYRGDENYLRISAMRIQALQRACFAHDLNFYVEMHIDRVSEDPEAFCKIFDLCPDYFEVNADISHYLYRNICRGPHYERIMSRVGHTHIRMARKHGDLSADVGVHFDHVGAAGDCAEDWDHHGVTWQAWQAMRPAMLHGLSSRAICGEAGPAFSVVDALLLDTRLVPLYRFMAAFADGKGEGSQNPFNERLG